MWTRIVAAKCGDVRVCVGGACIYLSPLVVSKKEAKTKNNQSTQPAPLRPPTLVGVIQRRRPMVNTRLQNFFPHRIAFIA